MADVDYRGSDGLGTSFRRSLRGQWGVSDVIDCEAAVRHLSTLGLVDEKRCCVSGGSAGGFTVLANLAFSDVFAAGASHYGIGDLNLLAEHTHKFESRYLDCLVGPLPQCAETYKQRSPVYSVDKVSSPLVLFQGTEDKVVPPNQADTFYAAMREKGLPAALVCFEGEQVYTIHPHAYLQIYIDSIILTYVSSTRQLVQYDTSTGSARPPTSVAASTASSRSSRPALASRSTGTRTLRKTTETRAPSRSTKRWSSRSES